METFTLAMTKIINYATPLETEDSTDDLFKMWL